MSFLSEKWKFIGEKKEFFWRKWVLSEEKRRSFFSENLPYKFGKAQFMPVVSRRPVP